MTIHSFVTTEPSGFRLLLGVKGATASLGVPPMLGYFSLQKWCKMLSVVRLDACGAAAFPDLPLPLVATDPT